MQLSKWSFMSKAFTYVVKLYCYLKAMSSLNCWLFCPPSGLCALVGCICDMNDTDLLCASQKWKLELTLLFKCRFQASEEASLRALESLMTEFFHNCTTNERKREIGEFMPLLKDGPLCFCCLQTSAEDLVMFSQYSTRKYSIPYQTGTLASPA